MKNLLERIIESDIALNVENGNLKLYSKNGEIDIDLLEEIKLNKNEIIKLISIQDINKVQIEPISGAENYPVSSSQKRLFVLSQFSEGSIVYNIPGVYEVDGNINILKLEESIQIVINRHEILRTIFLQDEIGEIRQFIKPPLPNSFKIDILSSDDKELEKTITLEISKKFNLGSLPLLRVCLINSSNKQILVFVMHHIISDGWSTEIFMNELIKIYNTTYNYENIFEPLKFQYKDYAYWQTKNISEGKFQTQKEYWASQLSGELPILSLGTNKIRPTLKSYNGDVKIINLNKNLLNKIKILSESSATTMFMTLLASVYAILNKYSGQSDIIIGTPIAGRDNESLTNQIGLYTNPIAIRVQIDKDKTFGELLRNVKNITLEAYENQTFPFEEILNDIKAERDISRNPIFDVYYEYHEYSQKKENNFVELETANLKIYKTTHNQYSKFDIKFNFTEAADEMQCAIVYNKDIYESEFIENLGNNYISLITLLFKDSNTPLKEVDYLNSIEKNKIVTEFNNTDKLFQLDKTLISYFQKQVLLTPDNVAIVCKDTKLTYKDLDIKSSNLASYLSRQHNVNENKIVSVLLDKSDWLIVAILGILKAGAIYLPIDPNYPIERIKFMLEDSHSELLLTSSEYVFNLNYFEGEIIAVDIQYIESDFDLCFDKSQYNELAYVIYTSGSTGSPKGVMVNHESLLNHILGLIEVYNLREDFMLTSNICFDASLKQIFIPLITGHKIHIFNETQTLHKFITYVDKYNINVINGTPSFINEILEYLTLNLINSKISTYIIGGDKLSKDLVNKIKIYDNDIRIINVYGPTETCVNVTSFLVQNNTSNIIPIGKPLPNYKIFIVDDDYNFVPIGVTGKIFVAGKGLAKGYLNNQSLTNKYFQLAKFYTEMTYDTGDYGRWLYNGDIEFIGRKDDQIKVRGYRIELNEIEKVLKSLKNIIDAVVIKIEHRSDNRIAAFIISVETISIQKVKSELSNFLPDYMIPFKIIQLEKIPLTLSGKLDISLLESLADESLKNTSNYLIPSTTTELKLAKIWSEVLDIDSTMIYKDSDFFKLGGHSLSAVRVISLIYKTFNVHLDIQVFFGNTLLENLSKEIDNILWITKINTSD